MHIHEKIGIYFAMGRFFFSEVSKVTCFEQSAEFEGEGLFALFVDDHILAVTHVLQIKAVFGRCGEFDQFLNFEIHERVPLLVFSRAWCLEELFECRLGILSCHTVLQFEPSSKKRVILYIFIWFIIW